MQHDPPAAPAVVGAVLDPEPGFFLLLVVEFDQPMVQDPANTPANWVLHAAGGSFTGNAILWLDETRLRITLPGGEAFPPRTLDYTQAGNIVRAQTNIPLETFAGFPVS